jgi:hypothetical protein
MSIILWSTLHQKSTLLFSMLDQVLSSEKLNLPSGDQFYEVLKTTPICQVFDTLEVDPLYNISRAISPSLRKKEIQSFTSVVQ